MYQFLNHDKVHFHHLVNLWLRRWYMKCLMECSEKKWSLLFSTFRVFQFETEKIRFFSVWINSTIIWSRYVSKHVEHFRIDRRNSFFPIKYGKWYFRYKIVTIFLQPHYDLRNISIGLTSKIIFITHWFYEK